MNSSTAEKNKAIALEAFDMLFKQRDYSTAKNLVFVILHGRLFGLGLLANWIAADIQLVKGRKPMFSDVKVWAAKLSRSCRRKVCRSGLSVAYPSTFAECLQKYPPQQRFRNSCKIRRGTLGIVIPDAFQGFEHKFWIDG